MVVEVAVEVILVTLCVAAAVAVVSVGEVIAAAVVLKVLKGSVTVLADYRFRSTGLGSHSGSP